MRGFVKVGRGPQEAEVRELALPEPGPEQVRVDVTACGVCGSDLHAFHADPGYEWVQPPVVLGHELVGTVGAVGARVAGYDVGDLVVAMSVQGCLSCAVCRTGKTNLCPRRRTIGMHYDGGLADATVLDQRHLLPVPEGLSPVDAALTEPLSVAVHGVLELITVRPGDRVVVSGPGTIGLLSARLAQLAGGHVTVLGTDRDRSHRLPVAQRMGLETAVSDTVVADTADVWIECSGAVAAVTQALAGVRPGGTLSVLAMYSRELTFFLTDAVRKELTVRCTYASAASAYARALVLLADGSVDASLLVRTYPLERTTDALHAAAVGEVVKPLIVPSAQGGTP